MVMSRGFSTSRVRVIDVTENAPSLIASSIECEWQSIMPGVTNLPVASITLTPAGALIPFPIFVIFPFCTRISVCSSVPRTAVITVAFFIKTLLPDWATIDRLKHGASRTKWIKLAINFFIFLC